MRKLAVLGFTAAALLTTSSAAFAQATTYDISASTSPATAGSAKKPVPASLSLTVNSTGTGRPTTATAFKVTFAGMKANTAGLKTCSVASINSAQSDSGCNKAAKIGTGYVKNLVGQNTDPMDTSIACNLAVTLYNAGNGAVAVFLKGAPTITVAGGNCVIGVNQALDGKFVSNSSGVSLSFSIRRTCSIRSRAWIRASPRSRRRSTRRRSPRRARRSVCSRRSAVARAARARSRSL